MRENAWRDSFGAPAAVRRDAGRASDFLEQLFVARADAGRPTNSPHSNMTNAVETPYRAVLFIGFSSSSLSNTAIDGHGDLQDPCALC